VVKKTNISAINAINAISKNLKDIKFLLLVCVPFVVLDWH